MEGREFLGDFDDFIMSLRYETVASVQWDEDKILDVVETSSGQQQTIPSQVAKAVNVLGRRGSDEPVR